MVCKTPFLQFRLTLWQAHGQALSYSQRVYDKSDIISFQKILYELRCEKTYSAHSRK
jgi:hypothetical protein